MAVLSFTSAGRMCLLASFILAGGAAAAESDSALKLSGFVSLVAGRVSGSLPADYAGSTSIDGKACPCYTADWGNAGIYTDSLSLAPESRAGIQAKYTINPEFNVVGQVVVRGSDTTPNVQWAYASYAPGKNWEFQLGRKRIPLYFYSDFQDIGASYPWVAVPPELYGWEATNYNGASVRYKTNLGDANVSASLFVGKETVRDSLYYRLYYDSRTKVIWDKLWGGDLEVTHGPLTVRGVYMQSTVHTRNPTIGLDDTARLKAYGIAANLDFDNWFMLNELTQLTRDFDAGYRVTAPAFTVGAGVHAGAWTPFINYARYTERTDDASLYAITSYRRASLTLRYDLDARSSVKGQLDRHRDITHNFGGDVTVMRLAYDRLF
ncbi:MAG: porin [Massilia sp.]